MHPAGAEIIGVQPRARGALVELHQPLAFLEPPQERRQRADIEPERADIEQMVEDAGDLGEQHANVLRARRRRDPHQLFDGQREGVLLAHRRDVIEPVEIRDRLQIGLVLDQLLGAAVQETDMRIGALDDFAVHFEHQPHDAVRRRVLRPEIQREIADLRRPGEIAARIAGRRLKERRWCRRSCAGSLRCRRSRRRPARVRPSRRRAISCPCPPTATGSRNNGIPASAAPARRRPASARRRSAPRHSR